MSNEEKVIVSKSKLTNLGNKVRETQGTQENYTLDQIADYIGGEPTLQEKTVTPTTSQQNVTPDSGYDGLSKVVVKATPLDSTRYVHPSTSQQTINPSGTNIGMRKVVVYRANLGSKTITPTVGTGQDYYSADFDGYLGYSGVYVNRVENVEANNIKKGVTILGVTGTLQGGGAIEVTSLPSDPVTDTIYKLYNRDFVSLGYRGTPVLGSAVIESEDTVYCCGGSDYYDESVFDYVRRLNGYPTGVIGNLSVPVKGACGFYKDNKLYVIGGLTTGNQPYCHIQCYDLTTNTCSVLEGTLEKAQAYCGTFIYNGYLYKVGGSDNYAESINWIYRVNMDTLSNEYVNIASRNMTYITGFFDEPNKTYYILSYKEYLSGEINSSYDKLYFSGSTLNTGTYTVSGSMAPLYYRGTIPSINGIGYFFTVYQGHLKYYKYQTVEEDNDHGYLSQVLKISEVENSSSQIEGDNTKMITANIGSIFYFELCVNSTEMYAYSYSDEHVGDYVYQDKWIEVVDASIREVTALPPSAPENIIYRLINVSSEELGSFTRSFDLSKACSVFYNGKIYFFGVKVADMESTSYEYVYDIETSEFTQLSSGHSGLNCTATLVDGFIYIFGGYTTEAGNYAWRSAIYKYDPENDVFTQLNATLDLTSIASSYMYQFNSSTIDRTYQSQPEVYTTDTLILILADYNMGGGYTWIYDISQDYAQKVYPYSPQPITLYGGFPVSYNGDVYVLCSNDFEGNKYVIRYYYDSSHGSPEFKGEAISISDIGACTAATVLNGKAYLFGIYTGRSMYPDMVCTNKVYEFNFTTSEVNQVGTLASTIYRPFTGLYNSSIFIMAPYSEYEMETPPYGLVDLNKTYSYSITVDGDYVYRNEWVKIGGSSGGIYVDKVTNLSISGTILSWTAPDVTHLAEYHPVLSYLIELGQNSMTVNTTSADISELLSSGGGEVKVTVKLTYTDNKYESIEVSGGTAVALIMDMSITGLSSAPYTSCFILSTSYGHHDVLFLVIDGGAGNAYLGNIYTESESPYISLQQISFRGDLNTLSGNLRLYTAYGMNTYLHRDGSVYGLFVKHDYSTSEDYLQITRQHDLPFDDYYSAGLILPDDSNGGIYPTGEYYIGGLSEGIISPYIRYYGRFNTEDSMSMTTLGELPVPLYGATCFYYDHYIYIFGGHTSVENWNQVSNKIYRFDLTNQRFDDSFIREVPANLSFIADYNKGSYVKGDYYGWAYDSVLDQSVIVKFDYNALNFASSGIELGRTLWNFFEYQHYLGDGFYYYLNTYTSFGQLIYTNDEGQSFKTKRLAALAHSADIEPISQNTAPFVMYSKSCVYNNHLYEIRRDYTSNGYKLAITNLNDGTYVLGTITNLPSESMGFLHWYVNSNEVIRVSYSYWDSNAGVTRICTGTLTEIAGEYELTNTVVGYTTSASGLDYSIYSVPDNSHDRAFAWYMDQGATYLLKIDYSTNMISSCSVSMNVKQAFIQGDYLYLVYNNMMKRYDITYGAIDPGFDESLVYSFEISANRGMPITINGYTYLFCGGTGGTVERGLATYIKILDNHNVVSNPTPTTNLMSQHLEIEKNSLVFEYAIVAEDDDYLYMSKYTTYTDSPYGLYYKIPKSSIN